MRLNSFGVTLAVLVGVPALPPWSCGAVAAAADNAIPGIQAHLRATSQHVPINHPIWVQFSIENTTNEPVTLTVPGCEPAIPSPEMGLPLAHVFSGGASSGVLVTTEAGRHWDQPLGYRTPTQAPILLLAPRSTVGTTLDLREYFPSLRGAGQFRLSWKPYAAGVTSETVLLTIAPRKQVELVTDDGTMTITLFYDDAPQHVANFLELAKSGFYTGKTFHRVEPGYMIQGGCPRGDGTGIRLDGKRIPAEFNNRPHEKGTVSMALLDDDPDSASCQFFISNTRQKDWDGRYTVFGELTGEASMQSLDHLMAGPVDDHSRPKQTLYIRAVRVVDAPSETP
jgi:cyclophilin family peptidyl-prolyl cis-trans isomerase